MEGVCETVGSTVATFFISGATISISGVAMFVVGATIFVSTAMPICPMAPSPTDFRSF